MTYQLKSIVLFMALIAATAGVAAAFYAGGGKDAGKGNDCLIGYDGITSDDVTSSGKKQAVECTDCDPTCDFDGDSTANNSCTFKIGVCFNQGSVEGCERPSGLDKATAKWRQGDNIDHRLRWCGCVGAAKRWEAGGSR